MDLHLHVERTCGTGLRAGLEHALRTAVRGGRLEAGTRLPSSRQLAVELGVARNTIADVYTQLVAEGYLTSRRGGGTYVAGTPSRTTAPVTNDEQAGPRYDLRPGRPDLGIFPRAAWLAATRRVLGAGPSDALSYGDPRGPQTARRALAAYLARVRGVDADPDRVVLCTGYRQAVALVGAVLARSGAMRVAVESPGLPEVSQSLVRNGLTLLDLPVDDHGARTDLLVALEADMAVLTPAHQFPTGAQLSAERRAAVLEWCRRTGGLVLEDDYDGEFRYDRQPVGALQGLASDHVLYAGSASKTLAPGLRLGWLVVPPRLLDPILAEKVLADRHSNVLDHLVLAELINRGDYDRHVRRARLRYRRRRDELARALAECVPPRRAAGVAAGLHAVVPLPEGAHDVLARLDRAGVAVNNMSRYTSAPTPDALVLGYATPPGHAWPAALTALTTALGS
ncbi:MocR-like pyridoxine biosynthesis transcription factor PdxR [Actinomadura montaniterrae]|uniref:MocR-like pyridoxine biosynthesis transcription factor PdxR n=1 Tax=Actinomadura montaniterrae TaxID=1803903 RepID=UPI001CEF8DF2|nr:PLP-dependent aminotransferase family protein [Actinomadura montaniterrae]